MNFKSTGHGLNHCKSADIVRKVPLMSFHGCLPTKVYDADAAWIMQSDKVISLYLDLLVCIRDEEIKELKEKGNYYHCHQHIVDFDC